jgi:hypothetical protein
MSCRRGTKEEREEIFILRYAEPLILSGIGKRLGGRTSTVNNLSRIRGRKA